MLIIGKDINTGKRYALYEPVHGSAPDIAGKGIVNPMAQILSLAMLFKYSFGLEKEANLINYAVSKTLEEGFRTKDIFSENSSLVGTSTTAGCALKALML